MKENKMGTKKISVLIWTMGLPMILSMVLQALYNVVDTMFVINMEEGGTLGNLALFAAFSLSNTLISITSYNYGMKQLQRVKDTVKYGILISVIVTALLTILYQTLSNPISRLFALTIEDSSIVAKSDIIQTCQLALHIATIGYVFMGLSVAIQGILQGFNEVYSPLMISALRLIVFVLPVAYLFTLSQDVATLIWWTFPIAEVLTAIVSCFLLKKSLKKRLSPD